MVDFTATRQAILAYFAGRQLRWRPWRELAVFSLMGMELSWMVPWYRSLTPATYAASPWRAFLALGGMFLGVHLVVRLMNFVHLRFDLRRLTLVILFAIALLVGMKTLLYASEPVSLGELIGRPLQALSDWTSLIPDEFVVALVCLAACWRGLSLAQEFIEPLTVRQNFRFGVIMFLAYVFLNTLVTGETPGPLMYLFLVCGLTAMGAARIWSISSLRGGAGSPFDRRWFFGMVGATLAVVGLAALAARLVGSGVIFQQIGAAILGVFMLVLLAAISPAIYFLPRLLGNVPAVSGAVGQLTERLRSVQAALLSFSDRLFAFLERSGLFTLARHLKPILLWSLIGVVGLLILGALARWLHQDRAGWSDERQSLLAPEQLWQLLRAALQNQLRRAGQSLAGMARLRPSQRLLAAAHIRRIYTRLMELAAALGAPRLSAQTPLEFLPALTSLFPDCQAELVAITQAYLRVRYGELPETRQEVQQIEAAWLRIQSLGQDRLESQKHSKK
jgi:hypothetical protein